MSRPIKSFDDLLEPFHAAAARGVDDRLGMEAEKFGVVSKSKRPVCYEDPRCGIVAVFDRLRERGDFRPIYEVEGGPVIALERNGARGAVQITLEPGGQLELSGAPLATVHEIRDELDEHLGDIAPALAACGVEWLAVGYHPLATRDELPWVPKQRYRIMRGYFPTVGTRGLDMMQRTATVQVNVDYHSEEDALRKLRVSLKLSPIAAAIFANSPFAEGRVTGNKSERALVWLDTDNQRTGLVPGLFAPGAGFAAYAEWALDIPMYFIKRDARLLENTGQTFRSFWQDGFQGERAVSSDWVLHLNTLFPEVRLQKTIELRSVDSLPRRYFCALPAFWAGILYDEAALAAAERLVAPLEPAMLAGAREAIGRHALAAQLGSRPLRALAEEALAIAAQGLGRRGKTDPSGRDEGQYLEPVVALTSRGKSPADDLIEGIDPARADLRDVIVERTRV
jgi:glutamate--cysteine ligase